MDNNQTQNSPQITSEVRTYLLNLIEDAGMTNLDDEMKEEMVKELFARLDSYISSVIVQNLPQEHFDAFIKMNEEKKSKQEIEAFLKEKVPTIQDIMVRAFSDFRSLYLGNTAAYKNAEADALDLPVGAQSEQPAANSPASPSLQHLN